MLPTETEAPNEPIGAFGKTQEADACAELQRQMLGVEVWAS